MTWFLLVVRGLHDTMFLMALLDSSYWSQTQNSHGKQRWRIPAVDENAIPFEYRGQIFHTAETDKNTKRIVHYIYHITSPRDFEISLDVSETHDSL